MSLHGVSRSALSDPPGVGDHPALDPEDVARVPELAILEAADAVLETAVVAVIAANPLLGEPDPFEPDLYDAAAGAPRVYAADAVVCLTHALRCAIDRYRCAVRHERR